MIFKDQLDRNVVLPGIPRSIVCLVPSQTELLVELGLRTSLVGVTKFCVHPDWVRTSKKVVGGTKTVHYDKIASLHPEVILCNKEENTEDMVRELERIAPVHVSDIANFEDALELISQYGELFNIPERAGMLLEALHQKKSEFQRNSFPARRVAYLIWKDPWMGAGGNTFINDLLELNGWDNVLKDRDSRYPVTDLQQLSALDPEMILLSSEPYPFKETHITAIQKEFRGKIQLVDGEYFSWYGSRLLPAFDYFTRLQKQLSSSL